MTRPPGNLIWKVRRILINCHKFSNKTEKETHGKHGKQQNNSKNATKKKNDRENLSWECRQRLWRPGTLTPPSVSFLFIADVRCVSCKDFRLVLCWEGLLIGSSCCLCIKYTVFIPSHVHFFACLNLFPPIGVIENEQRKLCRKLSHMVKLAQTARGIPGWDHVVGAKDATTRRCTRSGGEIKCFKERCQFPPKNVLF